MDFSTLLSGAAGAAGGSSGLSSTLSTLGSLSPLPFGGAIGSALGAITGLFAGAGVPDHERSDLQKIAAGAGVTEQQASWVCADESDRGSANYDDVCKKYANDIAGFLSRVPVYNSTHPQSIVNPSNYGSQYAAGQIGTKIPTAEDIYAAMYAQGIFPGQAIASTGTATQSLASALTGQDVKNIGTGILNGAVAGGKAAAMGTAEGQAATKAAINDYIKEYQLPITAAIGGIIWLAVKAFKK